MKRSWQELLYWNGIWYNLTVMIMGSLLCYSWSLFFLIPTIWAIICIIMYVVLYKAERKNKNKTIYP